ncbi:MAG: peptide chain release factor 1 [Clostridiales bacterium]|nr:peptide chain release factor 1 [Clostridiales bacterium]
MFEKFDWIVSRYEELSEAIVQPEVIADTAKYQAYLRERSALEAQVLAWQRYQTLLAHIAQAEEMRSDPDLSDVAQEELAQLLPRRSQAEQELRILLLPRDPDDGRDVIIEVRGGAGGEESCLFAAELARMYSRYAERCGFRVEPVYSQDTELGGVKECCLAVSGEGAYARMKYESGVHRVQRIPATEANGKRQTSTCTVAVLPQAEEVDLEIDPRDLRIDTYRASGHGGQHINKTDSAVRITHLPTGTVAACQSERSQLQNRARAMQLLRSRLLEKLRDESDAAYARNRRLQVGTGDRSERIRTYNFHEGRVTDHRIGLTLYSIGDVMDGDLDEIVTALQAEEQTAKLRSLTE